MGRPLTDLIPFSLTAFGRLRIDSGLGTAGGGPLLLPSHHADAAEEPVPAMRRLTRGDFLRFGAAAARGALLGCLYGPLVGPMGSAMAAVEKIRTRPAPKTGEQIPVIGLGTWQTFDIGSDPAARAEREEVLRLLFDAGGSLIDS